MNSKTTAKRITKVVQVHADAMDLETQYMEVEALSEAKSPGTASNFSEELGDPEFIEMQHAAKVIASCCTFDVHFSAKKSG